MLSNELVNNVDFNTGNKAASNGGKVLTKTVCKGNSMEVIW